MTVTNTLRAGMMLHAGTYRIERFIGRGGFGCTYEARHVLLDKRVAIKEFFISDFCNRDSATGHVSVGTESMRAKVEKDKEKFVREARFLSQMSHRGIVHVSDVFEENGTAYYVMDYIEGSSLRDIVKREGRLSEDRAVRYILQVCEALEYVHSHKRLHLDIKPGNIMIDDKDNAVLIDFGAPKQYDEESGEGTSTMLGFSRGYAPPEQMGSDVKWFDPAIDIYALGATLYMLLTGVTPPAANLLMSGSKELKPLPAGVSVGVRDAVEKAMRLNRKERPQTVAAFMAALGSRTPASGGDKTEIDTDGDATDIGDAPVVIVETPQLKPKLQPKSKAQPAPRMPTKNRTAVVVAVVFIVCAVGIYGISSALRKTNTYAATGAINGHEYVDLGLSVKWATCNVGASSPEDYGDYYAWGETKTKASYDEDNCETLWKKIGDIGGTARDVARVKWGGSWRLPTRAEFRELEDNCDYEWTTLNGVWGGKFTSRKNGNSVFFPAAGWRDGTSLYDASGDGRYWGSMPCEGDSQCAYGLGFDSGICGTYWRDRSRGCPARPVAE